MKKTREEIDQSFVDNQQYILALLGWREEVYNNHMYKTGLRFLYEYMSNDEDAVNQLAPRKEFWNWWKNLYNIRNESFIEVWNSPKCIETSCFELQRFYLDLHNPSVLACEIHPPRICYPVSFTHISKEVVCEG